MKKLCKTIKTVQVGNALTALSFVGFMALGVLEFSLIPFSLFAGLFVILGFLGKYIDEVEDDAERLEKYEQHLKHLEECVESEHSHKDSVCNNISTSCNHTISQSSDREKES